ncbi:LacI family DNA-binding transcriptional regulator [Nonomuraea sp. NPDC050310]|uniref:LacI family DNA-binding transcriptional regulator n=1 Tax=unclassified Nonomuraea TaxID=2593643 RepID=UPI0033E521A1
MTDDIQRRPPTSVDVARAAGVSQATVSYVLNDNPNARVSEKTRERVREAAARLGYVPHASARALRTGHSGLVLMPLPAARTGRLAASWLDAIGDELAERGYTMVHYGERRLKGVPAAKVWAELRPVAILVDTDRLTRASVDLLRSSGTRAVLGMGDGPSDLVPSVVMDHREIGALAARHLLARGRSRLAAIVPREEGIDEMGAARWRGVREVAPQAERIDLAFSEAEAGRLAVRDDLPDGIFAYNDEYAMLLISAFQDAGVRVPEDVAVVGADDLPIAKLMRPRLTSVGFQPTRTPAELVALLDAVIRGEREFEAGEVITLARPLLVARDSA